MTSYTGFALLLISIGSALAAEPACWNEPILGKRLTLHNIGLTKIVADVDACKAKCEAESRCKSIDYMESKRKCNLNNADDSTGTLEEVGNQDYYTYCRAVDPTDPPAPVDPVVDPTDPPAPVDPVVDPTDPPAPVDPVVDPTDPPAPVAPQIPDKCNLVRGPQNCDVMVERFSYKKDKRKCTSFQGCADGSDDTNNFASLEECEGSCEMREMPAECYLSMASGDCGENEIRYYYNLSAGSCKKLKYSGCGGNANNFETKDDCSNYCKKYT